MTVTEQQEKWIRAQIAKGQYASDSDVIRQALHEEERRTTEVDMLRTKLIASENSVKENGWVTDSPDQMLDSFKEKARRSGRL